jgi:hypothetical protein
MTYTEQYNEYVKEWIRENPAFSSPYEPMLEFDEFVNKKRIMTLKQKFDKVEYNEYGIDTIKCEKIADDYAIEFMEWLLFNPLVNQFQYTVKDLLEIFKKEKGL